MQINNERANDPTTFLSNNHELATASIPKVEAVHKTFCSQEKEAFMMKMVNTALYHMLRFATETAKQNETVHFDGGSLALVLIASANLSRLVVAPRKERMPKGTKSRPKSNVNMPDAGPYRIEAIWRPLMAVRTLFQGFESEVTEFLYILHHKVCQMLQKY
jgi:hypothetical protein